jgi:hypothetical protein
MMGIASLNPSCTLLHKKPSYPAHAGYPVRRSFSIHYRRLWNTGSPGPVCAKASTGHAISLARRSFSEGGKPGDDTGECGAMVPINC